MRALLLTLAGPASTGQLSVRIAGSYPLERGGEAYEQVLSRRNPGKVVLIP